MMRVAVQGKAFGDSAVLGPVAFEVGPTETVALTGSSGIGKSTLLRLIAGLDRDFEGSVEGVGRLAMVFQEPTLLPWRTALDNIILAAGVDYEVALHHLASVGLGDKKDQFPGQLSLGQQRRVAIARAFAREPETLLMDEPFASLDLETAQAMRNLLNDLLRQRPARVILVSHDMSEVEHLASRVIRFGGRPATIAEDRLIS